MKYSEKFVNLSHVTKSFSSLRGDISVLNDVNISVSRGELIAILGVSGTGKSTVLNLVGGIDKPSSGEVWINGYQLDKISDRELTKFRGENVGFIFQFYNLIPSLTALENVLCALEATGKNVKGSTGDAKTLLDSIGLDEHINKFPDQLSGGEQQRVAIARALIKSPPLLLADEPTGNLDPVTGEKVLQILIRQARNTNATLIVVTHNPEITTHMDTVYVLKNSQLIRQ